MEALRTEACAASLREAEAHVDKLIAKIQPNRRSIERRHAVFHYVQRLFSKCNGNRECTVRNMIIFIYPHTFTLFPVHLPDMISIESNPRFMIGVLRVFFHCKYQLRTPYSNQSS